MDIIFKLAFLEYTFSKTYNNKFVFNNGKEGWIIASPEGRIIKGS